MSETNLNTEPDIIDAVTPDLDNHETVEMAGVAVGTLGGLAAGAAIGTALLPGAGTIIGGVIGGIAGAVTGDQVEDVNGESHAHNNDQVERHATMDSVDVPVTNTPVVDHQNSLTDKN